MALLIEDIKRTKLILRLHINRNIARRKHIIILLLKETAMEELKEVVQQGMIS